MKKVLLLILIGLLILSACGGSKELTEEQEQKRIDDKAKAQNLLIVEKYIESQLKLADFKLDLGEFVSVKAKEPVETANNETFEHAYIVKGKIEHDGQNYSFSGVTAVDDPEDVKKYSVLQFYCKDLNHDYDVIKEGQ